jgi:hypothetical protein
MCNYYKHKPVSNVEGNSVYSQTSHETRIHRICIKIQGFLMLQHEVSTVPLGFEKLIAY